MGREAWCRVTVRDAGGGVLASWMVLGSGRPDLAVVDALARLRLGASGLGQVLEVGDPCLELLELLVLSGLDLDRHMGGQPEQGEEALGVEEGTDPADPPI